MQMEKHETWSMGFGKKQRPFKGGTGAEISSV